MNLRVHTGADLAGMAMAKHIAILISVVDSFNECIFGLRLCDILGRSVVGEVDGEA